MFTYGDILTRYWALRCWGLHFGIWIWYFIYFLRTTVKKKCNCIIPLLQKKKLNWYSEDASCSLVCTDLLLLRRLSETEFKLLFFLGYSKEIYVLIWRINKNNIKSLIYRPLCFNWYSNVAIMAAAEISNKTRARTIGHLLLFDSLISGIMTLSDLMIYWKKTSNHVCSFTVLLTYDIFKNTFTWQPLVL